MFCLNKNVSQNKKEKVNESCLVHESLVSKQLILMNSFTAYERWKTSLLLPPQY